MAIEKILNTRIQLKYDSLENWSANNPTLKSGELAIAYLPPKGNGSAPAAASEAVLFKVGPGKFNDLPWASALAADVYGWAKKSESEFTTWVKSLIDVGDINLEEYYKKTKVDELLANNSTADKAYADSVAATAKSQAIEAAAADATTKAGNAESNAKTYADGLDSAMDIRVKALEDHKEDYKAYADQAEADAISTAAGDATSKANKALADAKDYADAQVKALKEGDVATNATNISNEVTRAKAEEARLAGLIDDNATAIGTEKSRAEGVEAGLRTDVNAVTARVNAFLDNTGAATEAIDTLQDLLDYIATHDDVEINGILADIQALENKLAGIDSTVVAYVSAAIEALKIGDYAKAADLSALALRVKAIEDAPYATVANVSAAKKEATDYTDEEIVKAKAYADTEISKEKTRAESVESGLRTDLNNLSSDLSGYKTTVGNTYETKSDASSKLQSAKDYADGLAVNYATAAQGAKADSAIQQISTTANGGLKVTGKSQIDIDTNVVFVFNCGSSSELVD